MAGQRNCDSAVTAGRLSKSIEFFGGAEHLGEEMPNAAGDLYVDAGIAAADVLRCVRLGVHSNLLNLKNKAAYTHQDLTSAELKKMMRAAEHLVEAAKQAVAARG